ncbi:hypothetical protein [Pseudomonas asiatica]|uniref:Uncharacterized protein n=1 Tax=Pseudomonas asiatica TaxID=2219225 RepID=A0ABU5KVV5_9PSED|nr:hypothetical protein [Pseudomonas asiatica]MDZ5738063.1 hypothetical protein [Pseudomonas asiatica]MDZ5744659.1 hypothetical protein [Pseudomonas asiatica]MDZ5748819.1 hypothetical protein [Pseudomonas asiatica]MDZ5753151.1 hypothetical protein [Pseudomonas asiatica]
MQDYKFKLAPFQNTHFSEEEKEIRLSACLEDTRSEFEEATVTLENDILNISAQNLSENECLKRFKNVLAKGGLSLSAQPL